MAGRREGPDRRGEPTGFSAGFSDGTALWSVAIVADSLASAIPERASERFRANERWEAFTRFLDDGRLCISNNAAERALRGIALGRKSWLFAGSQRGGERAAFMYSLIVTAKMNDIDPQAWLADVLARMPGIPVSRLPELLPWNWSSEGHIRQKAA